MTTKTAPTNIKGAVKKTVRYGFTNDPAGALAQHLVKSDKKVFQVTDVAHALATVETLKAKVFQAAAKRVVRRWLRRGIVKAVRAA